MMTLSVNCVRYRPILASGLRRELPTLLARQSPRRSFPESRSAPRGCARRAGEPRIAVRCHSLQFGTGALRTAHLPSRDGGAVGRSRDREAADPLAGRSSVARLPPQLLPLGAASSTRI